MEDPIVVFQLVTDTRCEECGEELWRGDLLYKDGERGLCMGCADFDRLVYLHRGDAALTRRAVKESPLHAVVLKFSRARKRYERQGVLVSGEALARAEEACLADAELRERRRLRDAERRETVDQQYVAAFAAAVRARYPGMPAGEEHTIAEHACQARSGRVGRSAAAKALDQGALDLAVRAHVRHVHTDYDRLLAGGVDRASARERVLDVVRRVVASWGG